jgi:succinoglycan biosynthesis transport protein ExoP
MYITPSHQLEGRVTPVMPQQPLRPTSKTSAFRINVIKSLQLHTVTAITVAMVVLGLGLAVLLRTGVSYFTASVVYVSPTFPATLRSDREQEYPYDSYVQEQVHAITRYEVIADALHQLKPGTWQKPGEPEQTAVERLQRSLEVGRLGMTYQVAIGMYGVHPEILAEIVNAVTQSYLAKSKAEEFYGRDERLATLRDTREQLQKDLDQRLQEQAEITRQLGMASVGVASGNPFDTQLMKMRSDLMTAHEQRVQAEAQLTGLQYGDPSAPNSALNASADEVIASDPGLMALKSSLAQKRSALLDQLAGLTPNHPLRKETENQLAQIDKALQDMQVELRRKAAARLEQKLRSEVSRTATVESKLESDLQKETTEATTAAPRLQKAEELKADIDRLQARYTEVDNRISNLELESTSPGSIHLFSPALTPISPVPSKRRLLIPVLLPLALIMGVAAAVLFDLLDPHLYTGSDVEAVLGFAPLGMLMDDGDVTQRTFDEGVLRLAAGIDHATRIAGVRTFVFTGVASGAGTTSVIENLGSTLARLGRKTLTIDASGNTAPVAYVTIGMNGTAPAAVEFSETKTSRTSSEMSLQTSAVLTESLPSSLAPLSGFVAKAFQDLTKEYDIILVDAAPLLISAETEYLARCADVTVMIAEAGKTSKRKLTRAARLLERLDVSGTAAVINKVRLARVEETVKHDLKEFEARVNEMNLRWRPHHTNTVISSNPFARPAEEPAPEEVVSFARNSD